MKVKDKDSNKVYDCYLIDGGDMDTHIKVDGVPFTFSDTSHLRLNDGSLTTKGFIELCQECIDDLWQYAI